MAGSINAHQSSVDNSLGRSIWSVKKHFESTAPEQLARVAISDELRAKWSIPLTIQDFSKGCLHALTTLEKYLDDNDTHRQAFRHLVSKCHPAEEPEWDQFLVGGAIKTMDIDEVMCWIGQALDDPRGGQANPKQNWIKFANYIADKDANRGYDISRICATGIRNFIIPGLGSGGACYPGINGFHDVREYVYSLIQKSVPHMFHKGCEIAGLDVNAVRQRWLKLDPPETLFTPVVFEGKFAEHLFAAINVHVRTELKAIGIDEESDNPYDQAMIATVNEMLQTAHLNGYLSMHPELMALSTDYGSGYWLTRAVQQYPEKHNINNLVEKLTSTTSIALLDQVAAFSIEVFDCIKTVKNVKNRIVGRRLNDQYDRLLALGAQLAKGTPALSIEEVRELKTAMLILNEHVSLVCSAEYPQVENIIAYFIALGTLTGKFKLLNSLQSKSLSVTDEWLASQIEVSKDGVVSLNPYQLNRIVLHALSHPVQVWTPLFEEAYSHCLGLIEKDFEGSPLGASFATSSYPANFKDLLKRIPNNADTPTLLQVEHPSFCLVANMTDVYRKRIQVEDYVDFLRENSKAPLGRDIIFYVLLRHEVFVKKAQGINLSMLLYHAIALPGGVSEVLSMMPPEKLGLLLSYHPLNNLYEIFRQIVQQGNTAKNYLEQIGPEKLLEKVTSGNDLLDLISALKPVIGGQELLSQIVQSPQLLDKIKSFHFLERVIDRLIDLPDMAPAIFKLIDEKVQQLIGTGLDYVNLFDAIQHFPGGPAKIMGMLHQGSTLVLFKPHELIRLPERVECIKETPSPYLSLLDSPKVQYLTFGELHFDSLIRVVKTLKGGPEKIFELLAKPETTKRMTKDYEISRVFREVASIEGGVDFIFKMIDDMSWVVERWGYPTLIKAIVNLDGGPAKVLAMLDDPIIIDVLKQDDVDIDGLLECLCLIHGGSKKALALFSMSEMHSKINVLENYFMFFELIKGLETSWQLIADLYASPSFLSKINSPERFFTALERGKSYRVELNHLYACIEKSQFMMNVKTSDHFIRLLRIATDRKLQAGYGVKLLTTSAVLKNHFLSQADIKAMLNAVISFEENPCAVVHQVYVQGAFAMMGMRGIMNLLKMFSEIDPVSVGACLANPLVAAKFADVNTMIDLLNELRHSEAALLQFYTLFDKPEVLISVGRFPDFLRLADELNHVIGGKAKILELLDMPAVFMSIERIEHFTALINMLDKIPFGHEKVISLLNNPYIIASLGRLQARDPVVYPCLFDRLKGKKGIPENLVEFVDHLTKGTLGKESTTTPFSDVAHAGAGAGSSAGPEHPMT